MDLKDLHIGDQVVLISWGPVPWLLIPCEATVLNVTMKPDGGHSITIRENEGERGIYSGCQIQHMMSV